MKSARMLLPIILLSLSAMTFAQSSAQKPQSDAQKSFDKLKALAGDWEGAVTADPPTSEIPEGSRIEYQFCTYILRCAHLPVHSS